METRLRAALIAWLAADPALADINIVTEESPVRAPVPSLGMAASASTDWSTKDATGREVRVALELNYRGDDPLSESGLIAAIERRVESLPADQSAAGFRMASLLFLRARAEQRGEALRALRLEYRARLFAA